jgi:probable F420-dependent oxidoreductase
VVDRLGIAILGGDLATVDQLSRRAEAAGFDSVWTTEFYERSATISLAVMAQATERVTIGSAIAYAVGRSPLVLAVEARDLDELSGGRLVLGLGTGTVTMQRDWHSADFAHPAPRIEELVPLLRAFWAMDESGVHHDGRFYNVHLNPTMEIRPPLRPAIPVYTSGLNRRILQSAGRVADGLVGHPIFSRRYMEEVVRPEIAAGAAHAGRNPSAVQVAGMVICSVSDDRAQAVAEAKAQIGFYSLVRTYRIVMETLGFEDAADAIRSAWKTRDRGAMLDAVPDAMVEQMAVAGTPDEVRDQLEQRFGGVYEQTLLYPASFGSEAGRFAENVDAILETLAPAPAATPAR